MANPQEEALAQQWRNELPYNQLQRIVSKEFLENLETHEKDRKRQRIEDGDIIDEPDVLQVLSREDLERAEIANGRKRKAKGPVRSTRTRGINQRLESETEL